MDALCDVIVEFCISHVNNTKVSAVLAPVKSQDSWWMLKLYFVMQRILSISWDFVNVDVVIVWADSKEPIIWRILHGFVPLRGMLELSHALGEVRVLEDVNIAHIVWHRYVLVQLGESDAPRLLVGGVVAHCWRGWSVFAITVVVLVAAVDLRVPNIPHS